MNAEQIRAIALEKAEEVYGAPIAYYAADEFCDFATRFLIAITEKREPVGTVFKNSSGQIRIVWNNGTDISNYVGELLFTHPNFEQQGEVVVTTDEDGRCVCVTRQDEDGRILKVLWEAPAVERCAAKAEPAPSDSA